MKIAVHLDAGGQPVSLYEAGVIHVFEGSGEVWQTIDEFPFALPEGMTIPRLRGLVATMAAKLADCRTLISGDRNGYIYSLLGQELGVACWTSEGSVPEQLAMVERRSEDLAAEAAKAGACASSSNCASGSCGSGNKSASCGPETAVPPPEYLGEGRLRIDVAAVMRQVPGLNSRQILLPVIEAGGFTKLEVICDHLPRWFAGKLEELGLDASYETLPGVGVIATVAQPAA